MMWSIDRVDLTQDRYRSGFCEHDKEQFAGDMVKGYKS
jgi:hypothetical protein